MYTQRNRFQFVSASDSPEPSQNESSNLSDDENGSENVNKNNCLCTIVHIYFHNNKQLLSNQQQHQKIMK